MKRRSDDHICGVPSKDGFCTTMLDKYHPRCERHAVRIERYGQSVGYVPAHDVKLGDKVRYY